MSALFLFPLHVSLLAQLNAPPRIDTTNEIREQIQRDLDSLELEPPPQPDAPESPASEPPAEPETPLSEEEREAVVRAALEAFILDALDRSAQRYPWLVNTSDKLVIDPTAYRASDRDTQLELDLQFSQGTTAAGEELDNPVLQSANFSKYLDGEQFYWILDGNRVVIDTRGVHGDVRTQGRSTEGQELTQIAIVTQGFFGVQAVWSLPSFIPDLEGEESLKVDSVASAAVEVTSIIGEPIDSIEIDLGIDPTDPQLIVLDDLDRGETFAEEGGGAFFENLDADNTPLFLQGFPTVDLKPLLDGGVALEVGATIPLENFLSANITLGDFFSGAGASTEVEFSSLPGVKIQRLGVGSNDDLVSILSNPFLSRRDRDLAYLNSLFWAVLPQRDPIFDLVDAGVESAEENDWYRLTTSTSRNRTTLFYDPEAIRLTYSNIFSNPGISVTFTNFTTENDVQSLQATLGLLASGLFFEIFDASAIDTTLAEAKEKYTTLQPLAGLNTRATSDQRRAMNVRLNRTLAHANVTSNLQQVSGSWTFSGTTTPERSQLWQIRTGLHRRSVLFFEQDIGPWSEPSAPFFSGLRADRDEFGPLEFRGERIPVEQTVIEPNEANRTIVGQTVVRLLDGRTLVQEFSRIRRPSTTTIPVLDFKTSDLVFDVIEFSRFSSRAIGLDTYSGYIYLPAGEVVFTGTQGRLNYGVALGGWLNLARDRAPGIESNQAQDDDGNLTVEPGGGGYLQGSLQWTQRQIERDEQGRSTSATIYAPFLNLRWNTATNRLNEASAALGLQFAYRDANLGINVIPTLVYTPQGLNGVLEETEQGDFVGFFDGRLSLNSGWGAGTQLELGNDFFYDLEASYRLIDTPAGSQLALGGYYSNFQTIRRGLSSRLSDNRYGLILQYRLPQDRLQIEARFGDSDAGFEANLNVEAEIDF